MGEAENRDTTGVDSVGKLLRRNLSVGRIKQLFSRGVGVLKNDGFESLLKKVKYRWCLAVHKQYEKGWKYTSLVPLKRDLVAQSNIVFAVHPKISIIAPLYNTKLQFLHKMVSSVLAQSYSNWELVLIEASDENHPEVEREAENYSKKDGRIRCYSISGNKGIAGNTNEGFARAIGDYFALLDHDDAIQPHALFEVVKAINEKQADLLFSDEIVLNSDFKTAKEFLLKFAYGPDTLRGCNFMTHFCVFKRDLLKIAGGEERSEFDGAQDYDLVLRLSEKARNICHIPKALYLWRAHSQSTASDIAAKPEAIQAGVLALNAHIERTKLDAKAMANPGHPGSYRVQYAIQGRPLVSVVIPNYNHAEDLRRCVGSLRQRAGQTQFEVIIVENNSTEKEVFELYVELIENNSNVKVVEYKGDFNFSAICNLGVKYAKGAHILLLNNDIEILNDGFLDEMVMYSQRADVGAVGAMLYYPNDEVQHAGLFVGIGGTVGVNQKGHKRGSTGNMYRLSTVQNISAVTGAALMVKSKLYARLNGLDEEKFAVAFNDVDFCLRLREDAFLNVFTPYATAYHFESKSRGYDIDGKAKARFDKEAAALKERHAAIFENGDPYYNPNLTLKTENYAPNFG